jgi:hypothetical protein
MNTIEQYIETEMVDKMKRKSNSPIPNILVLACGIALLVLIHNVSMSDSLTATCLTLGILGTAVGIVLLAMSLSGTLTHYVYLPTGSRMKKRKLYLGLDDYHLAVEAIGSANYKSMSTLQSTNSSNGALQLLYSRDGAIVLMQAGRYDTGHFEPETPVACLTGAETATIQHLCK